MVSGGVVGGPPNDWQDGPSLVESIRRYRWPVLGVVLVGAIAAFLWSSSQPVRYEGVVRVFLNTEGDGTTDPGRIVRSQAEYLNSPDVLARAVALSNDRLTLKQLRERLTVEPARDADLIRIKVLEATPKEAAAMADTVVRAYREVLAEQTTSAAKQQIASLSQRQQTLSGEIAKLDVQLRERPSALLQSRRDAKFKEINDLADQIEEARPSASAGASTETVQERAAIPEEPAQPKPLRTAAMGGLLALVVAAAVAWWWNGRQSAWLRRYAYRRSPDGAFGDEAAAPGLPSTRLPARLGGNGQTFSTNGNGLVSGIADFDQIATSVQELFHFLEGPPSRLYEEDLPQLAAEEIAHRFRVDLAAILLDSAGEVQTMGSVGLRAGRAGSIERSLRPLIEAASRTGPRLVDPDEVVRLSSAGLGADQADSLALVPLVRDGTGFGVLVAGRRRGDDEVPPLNDVEVQEIATCIGDIVPYLWAWLLLRNLKLRLRTLQ
jgi:capsular polysaccharide biosynthesis protein